MTVYPVGDRTLSWQEDIIYFLMVDRFHDGKQRRSLFSKGSINGFGQEEQLQNSCGGNLRGVIHKLDYIKGLGCTAIWLSPVFENNPESYHGYAIQNFLKVDSRFGTEQDLTDLIRAAHEKKMKVYLDAVINHSGDNWYYKKDFHPVYHRGRTYEFGDWRSEEYPQPSSLRNPDFYFRKGRVQHWDSYPETLVGDFFSLKKFRLDESPEGLQVQSQLVEIYKHWIRVAGCDGFRIDAAKHAGRIAVSRFCTEIKEYAASVGKSDFFLFAEVPAGDAYTSSFFQPYSSINENKVVHGPDSAFDFPLHFLLKKVIIGKKNPDLFRFRFEERTRRFQRDEGELISLINFLDNHDQIESPQKERIASQLSDESLIAALGLLFTLPGVPCIYYGTEQGFRGAGNSDCFIREAMFEFENEQGADCFNDNSLIYQAIADLSSLRKKNPELIHGEIFWPEIFIQPGQLRKPGLVVFARELEDEKTLICFNINKNEKAEFFVEMKDGELIKGSPEIRFSNFSVEKEQQKIFFEEKNLLKIVLSPEQFIILK